ncbi:MAG: YheC/YheD family protein [Ectobacillus sp.]
MMLGLLTIRPAQEPEYFTEIAKRAHLYNIKVARFTPANINPATELVHGFIFHEQKQEWVQEAFPIPPFIYDRCFYNGSEAANKGKPIVEWLKKRPQTTFLGYGLPDKLHTYHILSQHKNISPYIPVTEQATIDSVLRGLAAYKDIVIKPVNGSGGNGFCRISYIRGGIKVSRQTTQTVTEAFRTKDEFSIWLKKLLDSQAYLMQPFLSIQDRYGRSFDIRVLLQKNEHGTWKETGRGVRLASNHSIVSNLRHGSSVLSFKDWKQTYRKQEISFLENEMNTFLLAIPNALEEALPPLFELGLDVSFDRNKAVWLLDINSKPGRKTILQSTPSCSEKLFHAPLAYCKHLAHAQKEADIT